LERRRNAGQNGLEHGLPGSLRFGGNSQKPWRAVHSMPAIQNSHPCLVHALKPCASAWVAPGTGSRHIHGCTPHGAHGGAHGGTHGADPSWQRLARLPLGMLMHGCMGHPVTRAGFRTRSDAYICLPPCTAHAPAQSHPSCHRVPSAWSLAQHIASVWPLALRHALNRGLPPRWRVIGGAGAFRHTPPDASAGLPGTSKALIQVCHSCVRSRSRENGVSRPYLRLGCFHGKISTRHHFTPSTLTRRTRHLRTSGLVLQERVGPL
jgi:hypothetical protein